VKFNALSLEKRLHIWLSAAERRGVAGLLPQETLERLAADYEVDAGGVDIVLRNLRSALSAPGLQSPESAARQLLRTHCGVMEIPAEKPAAPGGPGDYSLEGLSVKCPVPLDKITAGLKKFHAALRDGPAAGAARNICVLLHGPPGTGKTEFAKHIARETGAKLIIKNASDLLDAFVGGTEARIKAAFDEAEEERAILFMDEADSILRDRAGAFRSWEVSQTNELLGGMERFRGIMICATNFERSLDLASLRRFSVKIEFDYLSPGGALLFYKRVLPGIASQEGLSPEEERRLRSLSKLTPGDFKVVAQKFSLWSDGGAPHSELLDALEAETEMRSGRLSKKVGF
jgi:hypothetical protein